MNTSTPESLVLTETKLTKMKSVVPPPKTSIDPPGDSGKYNLDGDNRADKQSTGQLWRRLFHACG